MITPIKFQEAIEAMRERRAEALICSSFTIVVIIVIIIVGNAVLNPPRFTYVGRVTKLWIQGGGSYATVEAADGQRHAFYLYPTDYGILEIGQTCTFVVNEADTVKTLTCQEKR